MDYYPDANKLYKKAQSQHGEFVHSNEDAAKEFKYGSFWMNEQTG